MLADAPPCDRVTIATFFFGSLYLVQTSDEQGAHVRFIVRTLVGETQEAWDTERRYRDFTQLRKRLLRLGVDIPTITTTAGGDTARADLPKKTWRFDKFDKNHLDSRRAALEAYLQGAVAVSFLVSSRFLWSRLVMFAKDFMLQAALWDLFMRMKVPISSFAPEAWPAYPDVTCTFDHHEAAIR